MGREPPNSLNLNVRGLRPSATVSINEQCNRLRGEGRRIFKLGLGQSPFPVPEPVVEALREHAHEKDYLPVKGLPALREAVAAYHRRRDNVARGAEGVIIGPGSKELMFLLQLVFYGDLVIPSPSWVSYEPQAKIIGRRVRFVDTRREDGWRLSPESFAELVEEDPLRPSLVVLNYPNNPTGGTYGEPELKELAQVARKHGVLLLSDEIYGEVHHSGEHLSIAQYYPEGTIISGGLSKWCGAGGWRLGTFLFPPNLHWLLDAMAVAASETFTSTSAPIQYAAVTAYQDTDDLRIYLERSRRVLGALGSFVAAKLRAAGAHCDTPQGGFYVFADLRDMAERLGTARGVTDGPSLCRRLLEDTGVAVLPGSDFGRHRRELTLRLAYVDFDGARALEGAARAGESELSEDFVRAHCENVVEAVERLCAWISE